MVLSFIGIRKGSQKEVGEIAKSLLALTPSPSPREERGAGQSKVLLSKRKGGAGKSFQSPSPYGRGI
jgi:hypothetical protein